MFVLTCCYASIWTAINILLGIHGFISYKWLLCVLFIKFWYIKVHVSLSLSLHFCWVIAHTSGGLSVGPTHILGAISKWITSLFILYNLLVVHIWWYCFLSQVYAVVSFFDSRRVSILRICGNYLGIICSCQCRVIFVKIERCMMKFEILKLSCVSGSIGLFILIGCRTNVVVIISGRAIWRLRHVSYFCVVNRVARCNYNRLMLSVASCSWTCSLVHRVRILMVLPASMPVFWSIFNRFVAPISGVHSALWTFVTAHIVILALPHVNWAIS